MKIPLLILFILLSFSSKAQESKAFQEYTKQIALIQKRHFDTVIAYIETGYSDYNVSELKGVGSVSLYGLAILVGFKKGKASIAKIVETTDGIKKSKFIEIKNDSTLQKIRNNFEPLQLEYILPPLNEISAENDSSIKGYAPSLWLHMPFCAFYISKSNSYSVQEFSSLAFKDTDLINRPNLNFTYNATLESFKLYSFLKGSLLKYEAVFDFGK